MHETAHYHLPGLFEFIGLYRVFLPLFREHREYFYDWCDIGSIYGAPADCIWGGGRVGFGDNDPKEVLALLREYGISARLTFSNSLLREEHLSDKQIDFEKVDEACHFIPSGMNVWEGRIERFDLTALRCYRSLRDSRRLERSLGTLGGGNHFIEIDKATDGTYYLVIYSGSRNLGKQVAEFYQQLAIDLHAGKEYYFVKREEIIRTYKEEGRRSEIQSALKELDKTYKAKVSEIPNDICWLYGSFLDDYLHDVNVCQNFASRSREKMAGIILEKTGMTAVEAFHTIHNYIDMNEMILRKGAIAAHKGEKVLIPINMRDGSVIAIGRGNPEWNCSAPHGAGRIMSRTKAKETLDMEAYKEAMAGIYTTSVNEQTIDEAPMAYKSLDDIIDVIRDSVDIIDVMKPVYNFKASDDDLPWKKEKVNTDEGTDSQQTEAD